MAAQSYGSLTKNTRENEDDFDDSRCGCDVSYHSQPENHARGNWPFGVQGTLALLGAIMGSPWVNLVPQGIYNNGTMFLLPYTLLLLVFTLPVFYLEATMGQFSSSGVLTCWMIPIFKGVGAAIFAFNIPATVIQSAHTANDLFYLHESVRSSALNTTLPWESFAVMNNTAPECGPYTNETTGNPEQLYYNCHVRSEVNFDPSGSTVNTPITMALLIVWLITCMISTFGIKSIAWVTTILLPVGVLIILVLAGIADNLPATTYVWDSTRTNAGAAIHFPESVKAAFVAALASTGIIVTYCSFNRFHNDVTRDIVAVVGLKYILDILLTTLLGGFMFHKEYILKSGSDLTWKAGDESRMFSGIADGTSYAIAFFMAMFFFRMLNVLAMVETLVTGLSDQLTKLRRYRPVVVLLVCVVLFLLSVPMATTSGPYFLYVVETYLRFWLPFFVLLLTVACLLLYGLQTFFRHRHDVAAMAKWNLWCLPSLVPWLGLSAILLVLVPLLAIVGFYVYVFGSPFTTYPVSDPARFPSWASRHFEDAAVAFPIVVILVTVIVQLGLSLGRKTPDWRVLLGLTPTWNPALGKHWARVRKYRDMNPHSTNIYPHSRDRAREPEKPPTYTKTQKIVPFYV